MLPLGKVCSGSLQGREEEGGTVMALTFGNDVWDWCWHCLERFVFLTNLDKNCEGERFSGAIDLHDTSYLLNDRLGNTAS